MIWLFFALLLSAEIAAKIIQRKYGDESILNER